MKLCKKKLHEFEGLRCIECQNIYRSTPEYKSKMKIHRSTPEAKAARKLKRNTPEYKAAAKAYKASPEAKAAAKICNATPQRRESIKANVNRKYATNLNYKIAALLRARLRKAIKNNFKKGSAIRDLGCSIDELKIHLESLFEPWMNWENHGDFDPNKRTWHIDHIKALANFDLSNREELLKVCHHTNLQPLGALENLSKGCKN